MWDQVLTHIYIWKQSVGQGRNGPGWLMGTNKESEQRIFLTMASGRDKAEVAL